MTKITTNELTDIFRDLTIVVTTLTLSTLLLFKFCHPKTQIQTKLIQYLSIIYMMSLCIGYSLNTISIITDKQILRIIFFMLLNVGFTSLYILIFVRMYLSFKGSVYEVSRTIFYVHCIWATVSELLFLCQAFLDFMDIYPWDTIFLGIATLCYMLGLLHVLYCFNRQLFLFILLVSDDKANSDVAEAITEFIQIIVKQTLIGSIMVGSMVLYVLCLLFITTFDPNKKYYFLVEIRTWFVTPVVCVISFCIYLSFPNTKSAYGQCCNVCHKKCEALCNYTVSKYISQRKNIPEV
eukprot:199387_1